MQNLC